MSSAFQTFLLERFVELRALEVVFFPPFGPVFGQNVTFSIADCKFSLRSKFKQHTFLVSSRSALTGKIIADTPAKPYLWKCECSKLTFYHWFQWEIGLHTLHPGVPWHLGISANPFTCFHLYPSCKHPASFSFLAAILAELLKTPISETPKKTWFWLLKLIMAQNDKSQYLSNYTYKLKTFWQVFSLKINKLACKKASLYLSWFWSYWTLSFT